MLSNVGFAAERLAHVVATSQGGLTTDLYQLLKAFMKKGCRSHMLLSSSSGVPAQSNGDEASSMLDHLEQCLRGEMRKLSEMIDGARRRFAAGVDALSLVSRHRLWLVAQCCYQVASWEGYRAGRSLALLLTHLRSAGSPPLSLPDFCSRFL